MPKHLFKKYLPHPDTIIENRWIKILGPRLKESGLWHINRKSCSSGVAIGIFCAFIPVPFQMLLAAIGALLFRGNILIAVPTVWISNPVTIPAILYLCYITGAMLLGSHIVSLEFEFTLHWLWASLSEVWQPFLLGSLVVAIVASFIGFFLVQFIWRLHIWNHIKQKKNRRA